MRGQGLRRFGELLAETYLRRHPDASAAQLDKERSKPLRAPLIVVVAAIIDARSHIPAVEQLLSAGAAAQNIMLAAFATGYGCAWKTGDAAYDGDVKIALGLRAIDAIVGFLYLGTSAEALPPPPPIDLERYVSAWPA